MVSLIAAKRLLLRDGAWRSVSALPERIFVETIRVAGLVCAGHVSRLGLSRRLRSRVGGHGAWGAAGAVRLPYFRTRGLVEAGVVVCPAWRDRLGVRRKNELRQDHRLHGAHVLSGCSVRLRLLVCDRCALGRHWSSLSRAGDDALAILLRRLCLAGIRSGNISSIPVMRRPGSTTSP